MIDRRAELALARNPRRCVCQGGHHGPSARSASAHLTSCRHSTLADDTRPGRKLRRMRPLIGTRRWIPIEEDDE